MYTDFEKVEFHCARRQMKKDSNGATIYGPILVRYKNIDQRNYLFKNKKYLAKAKLENVINGAKKVFINENLTPKNKKVLYHANFSGNNTTGVMFGQ